MYDIRLKTVMSSECKRVKLGDVCSIESGGTPVRSKSTYWNKGTIPWVKIRDINSKYVSSTEEFISVDGLNNSSAKLLKRGTILYSISATIGDVAILEIDAATNQAIASIAIKDSEIIAHNYLYHCLYFIKDDMVGIGRGVVQHNVNLTMLRRLNMCLPTIAEQQIIANKLDKASELLELRKKQLKELDILSESVFYDMFGDPMENEKGWDIKTINDIAQKILGGSTPLKTERMFYTNGTVPWLTSKDIKSDYIGTSRIYITEEAVKKTRMKYIPKESLLMVIRSGVLKHTFPLAINTKVVAINQDIKAIICDKTIKVEYLFYLLKVISPYFLSNVRCVTAENIEFSIIENRPIPIPPLLIQERFVAIIEKIDQQKEQVRKALQESKGIYQKLMQDLLNISVSS